MRKNILKRALSVLALLAFSVFLPIGGEVSNAGTIESTDVLVDYNYQTLTVNTDEDKIIYYTDVYSEDYTKWYTCEVVDKKAVFDISWVKSSVTVRLYLRGDVNETVINKDITWQENLAVTFAGSLRATDITEAKEWKAVYAAYPNFDESTGYFLFTLKAKGRATSYFDLANIEWRKGDAGTWRSFSELNPKEMYIKGITLNFRVKATNDALVTKNGATSINDGTRTSSIAKITMAKLANAPQAKVDFSGMTLDIRNGLEYSLNKSEWILCPLYSKNGNVDTMFVTDSYRTDAISLIRSTVRVTRAGLYEVLNLPLNTRFTYAAVSAAGNYNYYYDEAGTTPLGITLYVRTASTEKKAASKIREIEIPFVDASRSIPAADKVSAEFLSTMSFAGSCIVKNESDDETYQFAAVPLSLYADKTKVDVSDRAVKWITLKPGKTTKITQNDDFYIIYRYPGTTESLPSSYVYTETFSPEHTITFAKINATNFKVGTKLAYTTSTNINTEELTVTWQKCEDVTADQPVWTNITTGQTYTLTDAELNCHIRVVLTNSYGSKKTSEDVGPVVQ
ncbi:MAG: hypothetical protein K6B75_07080 [Lachnospiraceae bacterium]|nr:hypothetical protein [Lachnospiraceae bacterium]